MNVNDNIEWLKSLKQQIGQTQHCDLWHFEQVIDETIANLEPLAKPHGRLIDADALIKKLERHRDMCGDIETQFGIDTAIRILRNIPNIIEAENESEAQKWARVGRDISKGLQEGIVAINSEVPE